MKKAQTIFPILFICIVLAACSIGKSNELQVEYTDSNAIYKVAWQYIVAQINESTKLVSDAKITRMELVDTYNDNSNTLQVSIYALEYVYSIEQESGYYPGGTSKGSPYLFITNNNGNPKLLGVKFSKDILEEGGFSKITQTITEEDNYVDFSKQSTDSATFQLNEINNAMKVVENYYLDRTNESILLINTWFDESRYQNDVMDCLENSLYGINEAAERGDLIILYSDLYFFNSEAGHLSCNWKTIMTRDDKNASWQVVDAGY